VRFAAVAAIFVLAACGGGGGSSSSVSFVEPGDGDTVSSPVHVAMDADGLTIERSGPVREGTGHLHLLVDTDCLEPGRTIPDDRTHRHLDDGATETDVALAPGDHTLCLQAGNGAHAALDLTDEIEITVVAGGTEPEEQGEEPSAEREVWTGTVGGEAVQPACSPPRVPITGALELMVESDGTVTGSVTEIRPPFSCGGTPAPLSEQTYRIRGTKTAEAFDLTISGTAERRATLPIDGIDAAATFEEVTGGYGATVVYTVKCVTCGG
jgi:Domain of unknown function (DUF4399)